MTAIEQPATAPAPPWYGLLFWHAHIVPASVVLGYWLGGWWTFLTPALAYGVDALLDLVVPPDRRVAEAAAPATSLAFKLPLWAAVPVQFAVLGLGLWAVAFTPLTTVELVGLTLSVGLSSGIVGITVAHELIHRASRAERAMGEALMAAVTYTHFCIEHVHGHHRNVATPEDPATARRGESLYAFIPRVVTTGVASAWRLEAARLRRRERPVWSAGNRMVRYAATLAAVYAAVFAVFGWAGVAFMVAQSLVAIVQLEAVDYIEHYGLLRRRTERGYERVGPQHSWDCYSPVTNWYLFQLGRHADHHAHAGRSYDRLRPVADGAKLPTGYAGTVLLALVPPLWRRVMDPRVPATRR